MEVKWEILIKKSAIEKTNVFDEGDTVCFFVPEYRNDGKVFHKRGKSFIYWVDRFANHENITKKEYFLIMYNIVVPFRPTDIFTTKMVLIEKTRKIWSYGII